LDTQVCCSRPFVFTLCSMTYPVLPPVLPMVSHSQFCVSQFLLALSLYSLIAPARHRPSIVSCVWGKKDSGRNFGLITYAPFFGTPLFSYLYAFVSAHNSVGGGVCIGVTCWSLTFWVCTGASLLSFVASILLGQRWKGLV
jgi:hypothetical protein